jgi:pyruvate dehydrogenase E1 component beta subunit
VVREGHDVTIVAIGRMVQKAQEAAAELQKDGIHCEIIDLRTTSPLDTDTILESVEKTGRLVVVDEAIPAAAWPPTSPAWSPRTPSAASRRRSVR